MTRVIGIDRKPRPDDADSVPVANRSSTGTLHSEVSIVVPVAKVFLIPLLPPMRLASSAT